MSEVSPDLRPNSSTMVMRSWLPPQVRKLLIYSTERVMAVLNPNIEHVMIDGALFQDEVNARQIMAVPSVYLNGEAFGQGRMGVEEILRKLDSGADQRAAEKLANKESFDVLVVGGGPAGAAAAIYAARKGIRTGVVADRFGGQVLDTMAIENFISVKETEGPKLAMALEQHVKEYSVDVMNLQRAESLQVEPFRSSVSAKQQFEVASADSLLEHISITTLKGSVAPQPRPVATSIEANVHARKLCALRQFITDPTHGVVILREQNAAQTEPIACHAGMGSQQVADQRIEFWIVVAAFS